MSTYGLGSVFHPRSVAVVGASPRERSVGRIVLRNLRDGGFTGPLGVVNPRHRDIDGIATAASIAALGWVPELVVVTTPPAMVPRVVAEACRAIEAARVMSS